ncbi:MAG: tryptophan synthase subunit alpha [Propionibacteriaceae bacterium]|jgi:tryptophan synthase alpha chain|nr:tryptophan synthase subunit alpha [Propionibacteriaceae bacterium]
MNDIAKAFSGGASKAFIAFVTAGDPSLSASESFILDLVAGGADLIEIGIPFSDPIAEGPVIQAANVRALAAGATVSKAFELARRVHEKVATPLVFLTYLNPVFHYGYQAFCERCAAVGVSGLIIPDMPFEEQGELKDIAAQCGVAIITLLAPTSVERIKTIAKNAVGFCYLVSSMGVTGVRSEITTDLETLITEIKKHTDTPVAVGFGIHSPKQARELGRYADAVIVGSQIVSLIAEHGATAGPVLREYVATMKAALSECD